VPLPGWEENPNKRLYVWFDAVIGYFSASVEWARRFGQDWKPYWNDEARSYYFMGKDNITFHSQIWPAELIGHNADPGDFGKLALPTEVVSSEVLTMEGKQFSSSRGVVIYVRDVLSRYQPDALRYYLSTAGPENQDSDFTWADFKTRTNSELVAGWGNLVNRTASLIHKNFGEIPAPGELQPVDQGLLATTSAGFGKVGGLIGTHRNRAAVSEAMRVVQEANRYISETEPWKLTGDRDRLGTVLHTAAQAVSDANTLLAPFLPHSAQKVHETFGRAGTFSPLPRIDEVTDLDDDSCHYPVITGDYTAGARWASVPVVPGTPVAKPTPVFTKLDDSIVEEELERLRQA
jgi:methionyl-tRNA synthetase